VSFLKDLVTLRNPRSRFTFLNYLHEHGRLDEFINLGTFTPYREEISRYLQWVANSLTAARIEYGTRCVDIRARHAAGAVAEWVVSRHDGTEIRATDLVVGTGRDPRIPEVFAGLPADRLIHSTQYLAKIGNLDRELPYRIAVVGGAQSAAE